MHQDALPSSSSSTTAGNGSLFNPDEVRFMHDSLSSAESFDPFTVGAPGFKVPNVLPANLGGIGSAPGEHQGSVAAGSYPRRQSTAHADEGNQLNHQYHQNQYPFPSQQQQQSQAPVQASQLPSSARGGYGRDKAWQMQQLEALQNEREKYLVNKKQSAMSEDGTGSSSSLPDFTGTGPTGHSLNGIDANLAWLQYSRPPHADASYPYTSQQPYPPLTQNALSSQMSSLAALSSAPVSSGAPPLDLGPSQDLNHLALKYPSSHQFPAAPREEASKKQKRGKGEGGGAMDVQEERRGRSPNARPPWTIPSTSSTSYQNGDADRMMSMPASTDTLQMGGMAAKGNAASNASHIQSQNREPKGQMTIDMDAPYTYLPAPRPPPRSVDVGKAEARRHLIPRHVSDAFFSPQLARYQPHLVLLREDQAKRKEKGLSANIRKGDKKVNANSNAKSETSPADGVEGEGEKKKAAHVLLTEAEKKANHIASEQKRRANIRKGYELLCDLIPSLHEDGEGDEEEGEDMGLDEEDEAKGKKRRTCEMGGGAGDKIEGRAGPRSEAAILMAAVQHLRGQLETHRDLVVRKQEAQRRVAARFGLDISIPERL